MRRPRELRSGAQLLGGRAQHCGQRRLIRADEFTQRDRSSYLPIPTQRGADRAAPFAIARARCSAANVQLLQAHRPGGAGRICPASGG